MNIGVAAEDSAVVQVAITVPPEFDLDRVTEPQHWTSSREGAVVRFTGGVIEPFGCGYFSLSGTAAKKASIVFPLKVVAETGSALEYTNPDPAAPDAAQLVYVGVEPEREAGGRSRGTSAALVAVIVLVGAGSVAAATLALRSTRFRPTRPPPLSTGRPAGRGRGRPANGSSRPGRHKRQRPRRR